MTHKTKLEEEELLHASSSMHQEKNQTGNSTKWNYWPNKIIDETTPDYAADAIKATNQVDADLNTAWTLSKNNDPNEKAHEYAGGVVKRKNGTYESVNQKEGREGDSSPKVRKKDLLEGDVAVGDYHTHPYSPKDAKHNAGTGWDWDGQGTGPSGGDFTSLAYQKLTNGQFSIIEAGTVRSIIVVTDADAFVKAFKANTGFDAPTIGKDATIDAEIDKATHNVDYMEKNPNAKDKKSYTETYWLGLLNGLKEIKKENGDKDIGMKLLRSKAGNKSEYDTVYP